MLTINERLDKEGYKFSAENIRVFEESKQIMSTENGKLKRYLNVSIACVFVFFTSAFITFYFKGKLQRFDGLFAMIVASSTVIIIQFWITNWPDQFYNGNNAVTLLDSICLAFTLCLFPIVLFYAAGMNKREVLLGLHHHRWIASIANILGTVILGIGIILLIALLMTPDLGGHWG